jgi:hypothetical protein
MNAKNDWMTDWEGAWIALREIDRRVHSLCPGLFNKFSGTLLVVLLGSLLFGSVGLYEGNFWYILPFLLGVAMCRGFAWPKKARPSKVWLITFFGKMTTIKVSGFTLLLNWIPKVDIIGYEEFELKQTDVDVKLKKPIRCKNAEYILGFVSVFVMADAEDDPPGFKDQDGNWKSGGQKLIEFGNISPTGDLKEIMDGLDDMITNWVQDIANGKTSEEMETGSKEINDELLKYASGIKSLETKSGNNSLGNIRRLGIRFTKLIPVLVAPEAVVTSRVDIQVQTAKRQAEKTDTETVNQQIMERYRLYKYGFGNPGSREYVEPTSADKMPTLMQIRDQILTENLEHDGNLKGVINPRGINIVETT